MSNCPKINGPKKKWEDIRKSRKRSDEEDRVPAGVQRGRYAQDNVIHAKLSEHLYYISASDAIAC